jgi:DNA-directed RNA polymerase specialized sigma24 family protein
MLRILREWGELEHAGEDERSRRLYRCLRDAAGEALRREHGRRDARRPRPRVVAYDFGALEADVQELEPRERELTVAVLGAIVRDIADGSNAAERRALVDRGVLLAGLSALSEREAIVMIAVDRLGWDQRELAERLGLEFGRLRETLFAARKLFYGVVRHAVGVEIDDTERARLHAYLAGELAGRERRLTRRHVQHCQACQTMMREQRVFTGRAQHLLAPLPFVSAAHVLAKPATVKGAAVGATPVSVGLLGQPGATGRRAGRPPSPRRRS